MAENNDVELQGLYEDSPVTTDADWGDLCMGTHAAMGRTTASGQPAATSMTTSWPMDRRVHHTVSAAIPTTPALKNPTTMTRRPPR
jgi:hypothetical protein